MLAGSHTRQAIADEPKAKPPELTVKLGAIPDVKLSQRQVVDEAQTKRIKGLIADLAMLDTADVGLSATFSGSDFAPVPGQSHVGTLLLTDHQVKRSQTLRDLVALGPDALPHLLDALGDKTPTKIVIKHDFGFGAMWYGGELDLNPVNPAEKAVYKARVEAHKKARDEKARDDLFGGESTKAHTVTIGDVCFVAVGQIVGRRYSAVRYQPTACVVINSPTHDAKLRDEVRATWAGKEPAKKLFDSLLADYATEGVFNGENLNGWYSGHYRQCGAATRLLYYFPKESEKFIAQRLEKLNVGKGDFMLQWVANGVRPEEFIKAVSWCKEPAVRAAVAGVFKRAEDRRDVLAALPAIGDAKLVRERLEPIVAKLPAEESGPYGDGYHLLIALAELTPESAKAVFQKYLKDGGHQRHRTVCLVFREVKVPWDTEVLGPLLTDTRDGYMNFAVEPGKNDKLLSTRICDDAAVALSMNHPEMKFTLAGTHADLDKQIAVMREQLTGKK